MEEKILKHFHFQQDIQLLKIFIFMWKIFFRPEKSSHGKINFWSQKMLKISNIGKFLGMIWKVPNTNRIIIFRRKGDVKTISKKKFNFWKFSFSVDNYFLMLRTHFYNVKQIFLKLKMLKIWNFKMGFRSGY